MKSFSEYYPDTLKSVHVLNSSAALKLVARIARVILQ